MPLKSGEREIALRQIRVDAFQPGEREKVGKIPENRWSVPEISD
ncbi:MAG: hypothetical protein AAFO84_16270 [Cyanobacteria bacterium J06598_1]